MCKLAKHRQHLIVKFGQWSGHYDPTEIKVRISQPTFVNSLSSEYLTKRIHGTWHIAETQKALCAVIIN